MKRVALVGAHTALAETLRSCLEERELEVELLRLTSSEHIDEDLSLVDEASLSRSDLIVLAASVSPLEELFAELAAKRPVLDITGASFGVSGARALWPLIDPQAGEALRAPGLSSLAPGLAGPLVALLRPLLGLRPGSVVVATYESAAVLDKPGMDELSDQLRAVFSLRDVPRAIFHEQLAMNLLQNPEPTRSWIDGDEALRSAIAGGLPSDPPLRLTVTRALVPTFSADAASVVVELGAEAELAEIEGVLAKARGLRVSPKPFGALDAVGRDDVLVGRLRLEAGRFSAWMACDRLRQGGATQAVLALEQWLGGGGGNGVSPGVSHDRGA